VLSPAREREAARESNIFVAHLRFVSPLKPLTPRNLRPSVVFKERMTRWLGNGRRRGQAMVEAMVVAGVLLTVLVGLGFLVSAFLDNAYRGLVLISSEYP
jgi:hypothetical protein